MLSYLKIFLAERAVVHAPRSEDGALAAFLRGGEVPDRRRVDLNRAEGGRGGRRGLGTGVQIRPFQCQVGVAETGPGQTYAPVPADAGVQLSCGARL